MTKDEVLKEFRELLSQYTGEAITGHYNEETQQKMESLFFQAEARGRESVVEMIEGMKVKVNEVVDMDITADYFDRGYNTALSDLLTKIKEERGRATT